MKKRIFNFLMILSFSFFTYSCSNLTEEKTNIDDSNNDSIAEDNIKKDDTKINEENNMKTIYIYAKETKIEVDLVDNKASEELISLLNKDNLIVSLTKNGGFEQYGDLGVTLTSENFQLTATNGDVFLYNSRYICLFYNSSSWSYTRLGRITNLSSEQITTLLSGEDLTIKISIE